VFGKKEDQVAEAMEAITMATATALVALMPDASLENVQVMLGPVILRTAKTRASAFAHRLGDPSQAGESFPDHAARLMCAFDGDSTQPVACFAFPEVEVQRMLKQHGESDAPSAAQAPLTPQLALHGRVRVPPLAAGRPEEWVDSSDSAVARYCSVYGEDTMCGVRCRLLPSEARLTGLAPVAESVASEGIVPLGAHWETSPVFVLQQLH
jgi:hypothetical protein